MKPIKSLLVLVTAIVKPSEFAPIMDIVVCLGAFWNYVETILPSSREMFPVCFHVTVYCVTEKNGDHCIFLHHLNRVVPPYIDF